MKKGQSMARLHVWRSGLKKHMHEEYCHIVDALEAEKEAMQCWCQSVSLGMIRQITGRLMQREIAKKLQRWLLDVYISMSHSLEKELVEQKNINSHSEVEIARLLDSKHRQIASLARVEEELQWMTANGKKAKEKRDIEAMRWKEEIDEVRRTLDETQLLHDQEARAQIVELTTEIEVQTSESQMLRVQLKRLSAEKDEAVASLVEAKHHAENVAVVEREQAHVETSEAEAAAAMWRTQAEDAMKIAETSTVRAQALAQELDSVRSERDEYQESCRVIQETIKNERHSSNEAEVRAEFALTQMKEELRRAQGAALRGRVAAKAASEEKDEAESRRIAQLQRARHAMDHMGSPLNF